jgi:hypothetical protein
MKAMVRVASTEAVKGKGLVGAKRKGDVAG